MSSVPPAPIRLLALVQRRKIRFSASEDSFNGICNVFSQLMTCINKIYHKLRNSHGGKRCFSKYKLKSLDFMSQGRTLKTFERRVGEGGAISQL